MTVVSVRSSGDPAVYRIELSDGSLFSLQSVYVSPYQAESLCVAERALSTEEEGALRFAASCFRTERHALRLISRAEQSSRGLAYKLEQRGHAGACIQRVLARLIEQGLLSDYRYARMWLQARLARKLESPRYLIMALRGRGIPRHIAQEALASVLDRATESAMLSQYLTKNHLKATDRLSQKLKYEGFSAEVLAAWEAEAW
ncbi:MAG: RecX family transcriptional regulator [Treponema sp.]|jgi:regulatory protein|nr:RecX family transcriptional regulator [Treponema sp.]